MTSREKIEFDKRLRKLELINKFIRQNKSREEEKELIKTRLLKKHNQIQ